MRIETLTIAGFRGIDTTIEFAPTLALVAGANNSGKTSIIDAIRSLLQPFAEGLGNRWISASDFTRVKNGNPIEDLEISAVFADIPAKHQGRLISILAPSLGSGYGRLTLRSRMNQDGRPLTRWSGGDLGLNDVESIARDSIRFIYMPALRDASADLRPGPSNKLANLVSAHAPIGHADRKKLVDIMTAANIDLAAVDAIITTATSIQARLSGMTGAGPYAHTSELQFTEARFERIIASLQSLAGSSPSTSRLSENGLGYNNLLYVSVLLALLETDSAIPLNVLLVEEPESHLHPQLQSLLLKYLQSLTDATTQVIATTHSPQFASAAEVKRLTVLRRAAHPASTTAHFLANAPLSARSSNHLRRFLDLTKSTMLFSDSVILVEGIAELILFPALALTRGISLAETGITVVSVDGLAFDPFISVFENGGIPLRCAVVSDSDPTPSELDENGSDQFALPSATATKLKGRDGGNIRVVLATRTFEWDLAYVNFEKPSVLIDALEAIRPRVADRLRAAKFADASEFADGLLDAVSKVKGPFAQALADSIEESEAQIVVPAYVMDAINFAGDLE
ncbi:ATP-dependent endonuclease [Salinibacterium sp. SWN167]|uniref:ATP-dependent nuclease n=1 Tax=Salinibacterium sp. SWN167 TaxID=2792054 RepID=UPI0018CE49A7|nr:AAA family ATPase [Salinibacterium sp. SWN167]MBH0084343.1 AAA family ATPase [Salinibacterium sp. SWN167]